MSIPAEHEPQGVETMVAGLAFLTLFWLVAFYAIACTQRRWGHCFPPSTKEHENDRYWMARMMLGGAMALVVATLSVFPLWWLRDQSTAERFGTLDELGFCYPDLPRMFAGGAGAIFTAYTISDLFIIIVHGMASADFVAHHIFFIAAGLIIRGHCMMPYNAAILLLMEGTTPFLNYLLFYRHRGPEYKGRLTILGCALFVTYILLRVLLNAYGTVYLVHHRHLLLEIVPAWQGWPLLVVIIAGAALQFLWFQPILKAFKDNIVGLPLLEKKEAQAPLLEEGA